MLKYYKKKNTSIMVLHNRNIHMTWNIPGVTGSTHICFTESIKNALGCQNKMYQSVPMEHNLLLLQRYYPLENNTLLKLS